MRGRSCLILFQNIVPISLVITVELVKTIQAFFIYQVGSASLSFVDPELTWRLRISTCTMSPFVQSLLQSRRRS